MDADTPEQVRERVVALLSELMARNGVVEDDLISVLFTATADVRSMFPAEAARAVGFGAVPLLCAQELDVDGGKPRCIRVLIHLTTERARDELEHVYLEGAVDLRLDLAQ
ncbi:MAG TPA: chorismate mutase [Acidimicrobiales bacterium]